jgi:hypothetical protein
MGAAHNLVICVLDAISAEREIHFRASLPFHNRLPLVGIQKSKVTFAGVGV